MILFEEGYEFFESSLKYGYFSLVLLMFEQSFYDR